jgi:hypothetical protein
VLLLLPLPLLLLLLLLLQQLLLMVPLSVLPLPPPPPLLLLLLLRRRRRRRSGAASPVCLLVGCSFAGPAAVVPLFSSPRLGRRCYRWRRASRHTEDAATPADRKQTLMAEALKAVVESEHLDNNISHSHRWSAARALLLHVATVVTSGVTQPPVLCASSLIARACVVHGQARHHSLGHGQVPVDEGVHRQHVHDA